MDPVSLLAGVISGLFVEALKEGSKLLAKDNPQTLQTIFSLTRRKLVAAGTSVLLERVENNPSPRNIDVLEGEIIEQMHCDKEFLGEIKDLLNRLRSEENSSQIQKIITDIENIENIEIGDVHQTINGGSSSKQVVAENLKGVKSIKIGTVTQNS